MTLPSHPTHKDRHQNITQTFCMPHETQERSNSTNKLFDYSVLAKYNSHEHARRMYAQ